MPAPPSDPGIRVIKAPGRWPSMALPELWKARRVLFVLARREFKARYANMVLGVAWVLLEPLVMTIIIATLLGWIMGRGEQDGVPYPAFLLVGFLGIRTFTRVASQGGTSIRTGGPLVERIYLPRAFFPLSVGLVSLVDLVFMTLALLLLLVVYGIAPGVGMLALPVLLAILYAFSLGAAFIFAAASMSLPDMDFVRGLIVRTWFWLSPVIYSSTIVPGEYRNLFYLNPMVVVIEGMRWAFLQAAQPPPEAWLIGSASAAGLFIAGYVYFRKREPYFADEM